MSYFTENEVKRIDLPSNPAYWVEVKTNLKYADAKNFMALSKDGKVEQVAALDAFLKSVIVNWNLDDGDQKVAPIDDEHINQLEQKDAVAIIETAGQAVAGDKEEKADFLDESEATSTPAK